MGIMPGVFHNFVITEPDTMIFEVKPGPYTKVTDKDPVSWAPAEGDAEVGGFQKMLEQLVQLGE
ncbi:MAG: hypothetical protein M2R45_03413 [Verrucomicrobia subdivision 3 bacterium]|nr:hypothetical protein [Limisphaerales bacterium]MCS1416318.1 hypothetical protein [Limisphaerales bacterium]